MVKCVETPFEGEGLVKILWGFPCNSPGMQNMVKRGFIYLKQN